MNVVWFLYILVSFSYTGTTVDRLETYKFNTKEHCEVQLNRIQGELIEVYGDTVRLQIYCKQQKEYDDD